MLHSNNSFSLTTCPGDGNAGIGMGPCFEIPSLILQSNYSFPRFTYRDLAFPELTAATTLPSNFDESIVSISAVIPAIRAGMKCLSYDSTQIHLHFNRNSDWNSLYVQLDGVGSDGVEFPVPYLNSNSTYVGFSITHWHGVFSDLIYFWAKVEIGTNFFDVQNSVALGCNMTFEVLDVNTTFSSTGLYFDSRNPPEPLENTVRKATIDNHRRFDSLWEYSGLASMNVTENVDSFFTLLLTSPWAIPSSYLGDPSKNDDVRAAIQLHNGIIVAQRLALLLGPAIESNATLNIGPISPDDNDTQHMTNATVTDVAGRRRVVQDAPSTHILVVLLATTLVLFVIGWVASPAANVLPRSPTTIASVAALLMGGNIMHELSHEETTSTQDGPERQFWLGWGKLENEGIANRRENEEGVSRFGIFVADKEKINQT